MPWVKGGVAAQQLGISIKSLRVWADSGKISSIRTPGGTRLYDVERFLAEKGERAQTGDTHTDKLTKSDTGQHDDRVDIAYCRVSSAGQKADLERQVAFLHQQCPKAEIIKDVGSGLNFKRKGLEALLERALKGEVRSVTVAHRDRLCRFGFELIRWLLERQQVQLVVLNNEHQSPETEFTEDLLAIVHVFSCRFNGLRRYRKATQEAVEGTREEDEEDRDGGRGGGGGADRGDDGGGGGRSPKRQRVSHAQGADAAHA